MPVPARITVLLISYSPLVGRPSRNCAIEPPSDGFEALL
jgi:hypothetical protein